MFSFARNIVKTLEHTAESVISGGPQDDSVLSSDSYFASAKLNRQALRVVNVQQGSLAATEGIESWFDFIIGINGHEIPTSYNEQGHLAPNYQYLVQEISNCKRRSVTFEIWSAKGGVIKYVELQVNESQGMDDVPLDGSAQTTGLYERFGLKVQWTPLITSTFVYHVLDIHPNSPAQQAGLIEHGDYIIGAQDGLLATGGEDLLGRVVESKRNQPLVLYVYNHEYNVVRPVTITPADNWGTGSVGLLGCNVGYGLLHRIPPVSNGVEPGSVLFDGQQSTDTPQPLNTQPLPLPTTSLQFVPTSSPQPTTTSPQPLVPPPLGRKKKAGPVNPDMLDFLQQESAKSRELDHQGRSIASDSSLPPPPKK